MNGSRNSYRLYLTSEEVRFFQTIANFMWKNDIIKKPTVSKLSKLALNIIGKQYLEWYEQVKAEVGEAFAKQRNPIKTGPINPLGTSRSFDSETEGKFR